MDKLQIILSPIETEGGYGVKEYWRVLVNDAEITFNAKPFTAGDSKAILNECLECYLCGVCDLSIRRCEDGVVWFGDDPDGHGNPFGIEPGIAYAFETYAYEQQLGSGSAAGLPELNGVEIQRILTSQNAIEYLKGLYTIPGLADDRFGVKTLQLLGGVIVDDIGLRATTCDPTSVVHIRIGLDATDIPECQMEIGRFESGPAVRLKNLPSFPLWLAGSRSIERLCLHIEEQLGLSCGNPKAG